MIPLSSSTGIAQEKRMAVYKRKIKANNDRDSILSGEGRWMPAKQWGYMRKSTLIMSKLPNRDVPCGDHHLKATQYTGLGQFPL
jgi:hypothetical protein